MEFGQFSLQTWVQTKKWLILRYQQIENYLKIKAKSLEKAFYSLKTGLA